MKVMGLNPGYLFYFNQKILSCNFEISLPVKIRFLKAAFFATIKLRKLRGDKIPVEELLYQFVLAKKRLRVLF